MATFKLTIYKNRERPDKTWNVVVRFTHDRKMRYIPTSMYVSKNDLTTSFKIKNQKILDRGEDIIRVYRQRINELNLELNNMDIDDIMNYLKRKDDNNNISFTDFAETWMNQHTEIKSIKNYRTSLNSLCAFFGRDHLMMSEITVENMQAFERSLESKPRAKSLYPNCIVKIFNAARDHYNDEDNDIIRIKHSLRKYKPAQQNIAKKRALDIDMIRKIFAIPYDGIKVKGMSSRHDLALDCFRLSFCLMGINSADLFNAAEIKDDVITYERTKTKDRRRDNAEIQVAVDPFIKPLVEKYRGKKRVFNFCERFSAATDLNRAINIGLKEVGKEAGIDNLQFYAARHSFATIAVNKVGISKYIVNDMLDHSDSSLKITELYIEKDFKAINDANSQLIKYVFHT